MIQRSEFATPPLTSARWRRKMPLVLVVDDAAEIREMYGDLLTFSGFRVAEAEDGREAVLRGTALRPDVIVMDLALPVMDGLSAIRVLKHSPDTSSIPIIAVTGFSPEHYRDRAIAAGCDTFLTKPCLNELLDEVYRQLER